MIDLRKRIAIAVTLLLSMLMAACSVYDDEPKRPVIPEGAVTGTKVSIEEAEKDLKLMAVYILMVTIFTLVLTPMYLLLPEERKHSAPRTFFSTI